MSVEPHVSVVMSAYNAAPYLDVAVRSIVNQTFRDFEFIVVNDGSTDATGAMLDGWSARDPRLRVVHQENRGMARSLNAAIERVRAPLIARMDADDVSLSGRLERQLAYFDRNPNVVAVGTAAWTWDGGPGLGPKIGVPVDPVAVRRHLPRGNCLLHPTVMMRRDAFRAAGQYRTNFEGVEDYDLWLRLLDQGELANLAEPLLVYRVHGSQFSQAQIERQSRSALAAKLAYRRRREHGSDSIDASTIIDDDAFAALGGARSEIDAEVWRRRQEFLATQLNFGDRERQRTTAAAMRSDCRNVNERRRCEGTIAWQLGVRALRERHLTRAAGSFIVALALCPGLALRLVPDVRFALRERGLPERQEAASLVAGA